MDQILHRKLINEKNNLELQVAKANKEVAKLMETVQQYEAVLASLDEGMIPNKMKLRGPVDSAGKHERDFVNRADQQGRKLTNQEHDALRQHAKNDSAANAKIAAAKGISEDFTVGRLNLSTLGRAALQALGGSKKQSTLGQRYTPGTVATSPVDPYVGEVQTPRVAAMGGIPQGAFKQPDGNLGQVRRLTPNEAQYDASKRSKKPAHEVQEGFKDFVKDMGSQLKSIGGDALKNVKKDMAAVKSKLSPANIKAGVKTLPGKIEAAAKKMPTQQQNINFVKNTVVPMIGRVGAEMQRNAPKHIKKRNAAIGRIFKP